MLKEKSFQTGAVTLNYMEGPDAGPPLLLLHGITQRWQEFVQVIPSLTQSYHLFAMDFRGHGRSGRAKGGYRGEDYAQDVIEFIDTVIGQAPLIFGHSLGGMVSLYLSALYPSMVRAQAIGDSIIFGADFAGTVLPSMFTQVRDFVRANSDYEVLRRKLPEMCLESPVFGSVPMKMFPGCDDAYLSAWAKSLSQMDEDVLNMCLDGRAFRGWEPAEFIKKIHCPTLLIQADPKMAGLMTDEDVRRIKEACPGVQHAKLLGLGHSLHMLEAAPVVRALTNFLCTVDM
ncbi:MAG TPA: alpha/beta hydrolase [Terriglobales bacterium]|nr:alpha/beta hydrolase [Terriglobales bacterium]